MANKEVFHEIKQFLNTKDVELVAVSKTKPQADITDIYQEGQRVFGENKVQELVDKHEALEKDIQWHMIGHLQSNKVKYIASFVSLVHAVDSLKLLQVINKEAKKNNRVIKCLLQLHIADEETKFGLDVEELGFLLEHESFQAMENVEVIGLMGMATFTPDEAQVREEFGNLKKMFNRLKDVYFKDQASFKEISMGMSGDYKIAIEEGSTMVRIGSTIFGGRA
jgi:hypothetical protein